MDSIYEQDLLSVDMDDLGVRPLNWIDLQKNFDSPFGLEKSLDFNVFSAELQIEKNDISMSDEDDETQDYEVDPETGEKIFREVTFASNISVSSPSNDKWIEEYLSNIETTTNQSLPLTTNQSEFNDTTWLEDLIHLDETSDCIMFNEFLADIPSTLNVSIDDEYSTSDSNQQSYSSIENNTEVKLEKIEHNENSMSIMGARHSISRASNQGQLDEEALEQYNIPLTVHDITQSSTEEYNRHLTRLSHLTTEQIHIIKDIRRRGKNKVAAQNCRKRKAISVETLLEEVDELKRVKHELEERKRTYQQQIEETRSEYEYLHRQVLPDRQLPPAIIVK